MQQGRQQAGVDESSVREFLRQAFFREYSRYLSFHFPFTHERSLLEHLRALPWRLDQGLFKVCDHATSVCVRETSWRRKAQGSGCILGVLSDRTGSNRPGPVQGVWYFMFQP